MPTVTIRLDEETDIRLKRHLARKGETLSSFIRAAVVQELDAAPRAEPRAASLARVLSSVTDTGENRPLDHLQGAPAGGPACPTSPLMPDR